MRNGETVPKYGWVKDTLDKRDHLYAPPNEVMKLLPEKVDLRPFFPRVYNQGNMNSCTANAIAAALEFDEIRQETKSFVPSRLFIYYNEREMEGVVDSDSGAQIRDGIKSVARLGCCKEKLWPYLEKNLKMEPTTECYRQALKYKALEYQRLGHNLDHLKSCLVSGFPFILGIKVYSSFEGARVRKTGHLEMPHKNEKFVGKHAVIVAGYEDSGKRFIVRNSWGERWGIRGYFTIPGKYLLDRTLSADFWTIRVIR